VSVEKKKEKKAKLTDLFTEDFRGNEKGLKIKRKEDQLSLVGGEAMDQKNTGTNCSPFCQKKKSQLVLSRKGEEKEREDRV